MFFFNFVFFLLGALLVGVGVYASFDKWASGEGFKLDNVFDVLFNLALLLVIVGGIVFIVSGNSVIWVKKNNFWYLVGKWFQTLFLLFTCKKNLKVFFFGGGTFDFHCKYVGNRLLPIFFFVNPPFRSASRAASAP